MIPPYNSTLQHLAMRFRIPHNPMMIRASAAKVVLSGCPFVDIFGHGFFQINEIFGVKNFTEPFLSLSSNSARVTSSVFQLCSKGKPHPLKSHTSTRQFVCHSALVFSSVFSFMPYPLFYRPLKYSL